MSSVSVVCRAYDAEAPYIRSFIDHYTRIGCEAIHIAVPKDNPCGRLLEQLHGYDHVQVHRDHQIDHFNEAQNAALPHVKTSHILWVDVDEYLDAHEIAPLLEHDYVNLSWVIAPYNFCGEATGTVRGLADRQVKYLVRTNLCEKLNIHDASVKRPVQRHAADVPLLHYVYRSYEDLFLRCTLGNYQSYQKTFADQLSAGIDDCTQLPRKYKMLAIYQRLVTAGQSYYPNHCAIDVKLEQEMVSQSAFAGSYEGLRESLLHYFSRIDLNAFLRGVRAHPKYREYGRLPHFVLADIADATLIGEVGSASMVSRRSPRRFDRLGRFFKRLKQ